MSSTDDLSNLINDAETQIESGTEQVKHVKPRRRKKRHLGFLLPLVLFVLAYYLYSRNQATLPSDIAIANQLTELVTEARRQVQAGTVQGELPPVLPDAALGAMVDYQRVGASYILSASMMGVFVEINEAGELTVTGVAE